MPEGEGPDRGRARLLIVNVVAMAAGLVFLIAACVLLGWHYAVGPLPKWVGVLVAALGFISATAIVSATAMYYWRARNDRRRS